MQILVSKSPTVESLEGFLLYPILGVLECSIHPTLGRIFFYQLFKSCFILNHKSIILQISCKLSKLPGVLQI